MILSDSFCTATSVEIGALILSLFFTKRLECRVDAYTPPMVTWFVNGMEIKPSPHYEMLYEDGKSVLLIIEVGPEDTGEYTMKATSDEFGEIVSSTTLYVQGNGKGHHCFSY